MLNASDGAGDEVLPLGSGVFRPEPEGDASRRESDEFRACSACYRELSTFVQ